MTRSTGLTKSPGHPMRIMLLTAIGLVAAFLTGCQATDVPGTAMPITRTPTPTQETWVTPSPTPAEDGPVLIPTPAPEETTWNSTPLMVRRFYLTTRQGRARLFIEAMLPTPCHEARAQVQVRPGRIQVDVFAVLPPGQEVCIQVLSYLSGYVDLTPWLEADPNAEVWLGNQRAPVQEGLAPPMLPTALPPTVPRLPSGGGPMSTLPTPGPQESSWQPGPFYLQEVRLEREGDTWRLMVSGSAPTPCHQVRHRVTLEGERLLIEIFTLREPKAMCIEMLQPFSGEVDLTPWARQYPGIEVWVNNQRVGALNPGQE